MRGIYERLYVGDQDDFENEVRGQRGWKVVQACRDPYHREALGYKGRAAPKDHPGYLFLEKGDRLILNLLDADDSKYIPREIVDAALAFTGKWLRRGWRVLIHCNQGRSRGPAIGLLFLGTHTSIFDGLTFDEAEHRFREIYPDYDPNRGVRGFLIAHWSRYCRRPGAGEQASWAENVPPATRKAFSVRRR
jgi:hypothetical protein